MTFLPLSNLIASGHEDGVVRLWNIDSGKSIELEGGNEGKNEYCHVNTVTCVCPCLWKN